MLSNMTCTRHLLPALVPACSLHELSACSCSPIGHSLPSSLELPIDIVVVCGIEPYVQKDYLL